MCLCFPFFPRGAWRLTMHVGRTTRPRWEHRAIAGCGAVAGVPIPVWEKASYMGGLLSRRPRLSCEGLCGAGWHRKPTPCKHTGPRIGHIAMHRGLCDVDGLWLSVQKATICVCAGSSLAHEARRQIGGFWLKHGAYQQRCHRLPAASSIGGCTLALIVCPLAACWSESFIWKM